MPGRFLSGFQIQMAIDAVSSQFKGRHWGIVRANEGEFVCPDTFGELAALPVAPAVCMYLDQQDSAIPKWEVARRNGFAQHYTRKYCIARDFVACPL
jgi:hypothetical protein